MMPYRQQTCLVALILILAFVQNAYFLYFYQKGIYVDQWDIVPILEQYLQGGNWLQMTLVQHGGHYHTTAYWLMLPLAKLTAWNLLYETWLIVISNCLSFYLLFRVFLSRLVKQPGRLSVVLAMLFVTLYFNLGHGGNALWSWQLSIYLALLGTTLTFFAFSKPISKRYFALAIIGTSITTFSYSSGFALWAVGAFIIFFLRDLSKRHRLTYLSLWLVIAFSNCVYYVLNIHNTGMTGEFGFDLIETGLFLLYYLGTPIAYFSRDASILVALVALITYVYLLIKFIKLEDDWITLAIAMGLFAIISGLLISFGRLEYGIDQARSFRYLIFSQFFWFSLICLIWKDQQTSKTNLRFMQIPLFLLLALVAFNSQKTGRSAAEVAQTNNGFYQQLVEANSETKQTILLSSLDYPPRNILRQHIEVLKKYRLNLYRSD